MPPVWQQPVRRAHGGDGVRARPAAEELPVPGPTQGAGESHVVPVPLEMPGRSCNMKQRLASYPKGSVVLTTATVVDARATEQEVLTTFDAAFKRRLHGCCTAF